MIYLNVGDKVKFLKNHLVYWKLDGNKYKGIPEGTYLVKNVNGFREAQEIYLIDKNENEIRIVWKSLWTNSKWIKIQ